MTNERNNPEARPPVVAVLGHVDHGKSTLLDFIRKSNTVAHEAGGITQRVAAYEAEHKGKRITFLDTPGHAAFAAIRARGATAADIAILVVAGDDGVKAQTLEALRQIRETKTPFIVAINKMDKPSASLERTQASLLEHGVFLEKFGGDVPWCAVSAKTGAGVEELLDLILLVAEIEGFKGNPSAPAEGYVIEARRDRRRGIAATLIIADGALETGMSVLAGRAISPVRIMEDYQGRPLKKASFSAPVFLIGFDELPEAGEKFRAYATRREAEAARPAPVARAAPQTSPSEETRGPFLMPVIVRADTQGSLEAIAHELARIGDERARISIVLSGIGDISENDVKTALSGSIPAAVAGFNVGADPIAEALARERGVRIETFGIIYKLTERLEELLRESAPKRRVEEVVGRAKVLKRFSSRKGEHLIGGRVAEGYLARRLPARVLRGSALVGEGFIESIQANKQNVERIEAGREFGARIEAPFKLAQGDTLECFVSGMK